MGTAFGLFFDKFKVYIVLFLLVVIAALVAYHTITTGLLRDALKAAQDRVGELVVETSALRTANRQMAADIETQNRAVDALKKEAIEQDRLAKEAMDRVKREGDMWKGKYDAIFKTPPAGKDDCANTFLLLDQYQALRISETLEAAP